MEHLVDAPLPALLTSMPPEVEITITLVRSNTCRVGMLNTHMFDRAVVIAFTSSYVTMIVNPMQRKTQSPIPFATWIPIEEMMSHMPS